LNKHPARAHFFLLLSGFEMGLAELIRRRNLGDPRNRPRGFQPTGATSCWGSIWRLGTSAVTSTWLPISCWRTC
jgi:hypothetical protein